MSVGQNASGANSAGTFFHRSAGSRDVKAMVTYVHCASTANVYRLSRVKVSGTCVQPFQRYWGFGVFGGLWVFCVFGCLGVLACLRVLGCFGVWGCWGFCGVWGCWGVLGLSGVSGFGVFWSVWGLRLRG